VALPLISYFAVLKIGVPAVLDLSPLSVLFPIVAIIGVLLLVALSRTSRAAHSAAAALTIVLFALPLSARWHSGRSDGTQFGGLLPFSDANGYYHCARVLAEGGDLRQSAYPVFCSRRPLFTAALAGLLALTHQNLRWTLALLVLTTAFACFVAAREVQATHGPAAATLFLIVLFLFYRPLMGATLTEHLGLSLGAVGFAGLWRGAEQKTLPWTLAGLALVALALNARAGAMLVLPALAIWSGWRFAGAARFSWRNLLLAGAAIVMAFAFNVLLIRAIGVQAGAFSNFSYSFYGLVFGGDWRSGLQDHPRLSELRDIEQPQALMALALEGVRRDPWRLVKGCLRAWRLFLGTGYAFHYLIDRRLNSFLRVLTVVGLLACLLKWRQAGPSALLTVAVGTVASVPFVPPWDVEVRAYAATMPFVAALPALAVSLVAAMLRRVPTTAHQGARHASTIALIASVGVPVCLALLSPLALAVLRSASHLVDLGPSRCGDPLYVRLPAGSLVKLVANNAPDVCYPSELRQRAFRRGLRDFTPDYPGLVNELASVRAPVIIFNVLDVRSFRDAFLVADTRMVEEAGSGRGFWKVCAEPANDPMARSYGLRYATSIEAVSPLRGR